jgi:hypothetical protein
MNNDVSIPAFNWFVSSLVNDVADVEWIKMTDDELKTAMGQYGDSVYPYNVVTHPIEKGKNIILENGKVTIKCNSQEVRDYIIKLAMEYDALDRKNRYLERETRASVWKPVSELPPHSMVSSRPDWYHFIVDSPILHYIGGVMFGVRKKGKWYIIVKGKEIEHPVTHYRDIPPHAEETVPYESIKDEVQQLRHLFAK